MPVFSRILTDHRPLVVTDTETTGLRAHHHRIIEIGAVRISGDGSRTGFSRLIDPGLTIPQGITRITGITTAMVRGQGDAFTVMPDYLDFLADGVFVAHNIGFDYSFVNAELERIGAQPLENVGLCTLRLARRLLPGLRSKGLGNLARFFKIPAEGRHRAFRDAEITAEVLSRLMIIAEEEHGVTCLDDLLEMQRRTYARVNPYAKHVVHIRQERLPQLPAEPGVYFMRDGRDQVLYVGKARDLSSRVRSYFNAIEAHPPRIRQLIAQVRDVSWQTTSTELEALVEESRLIKELDPAFNRAQKRYMARPYLRLGVDEAYPRLTVQVICREDGAQYFGPLRSRAEAATILEIVERYFRIRTCGPVEFDAGKRCMRADIGRCDAPCEGALLGYEIEIARLRAFLGGDITDVCARIEEDMVRSARSLAFEEAARLRDWITLLDGRVARASVVAAAVDGPARVYVQPPSNGSPGTCATLRRGVLVDVFGFTGEETGVLRKRLARAMAAEDGHLSGLDRIRSDARRILDHWLNVNRDEVLTYEKRDDEEETVFVERVVSGLG